MIMKCALAVLMVVFLMPLAIAAPACEIRSGLMTSALIELYTSEGCSSCPPADQRLSSMPDGDLTVDLVVPLAMHVNYWDYLGWRDSFAKPEFTERHGWLVRMNHHRTTFTPHFFVAGTEVQDWRSDLREEIERVNRLPAQAAIRLGENAATTDRLQLQIDASSQVVAPLAVFIALTENKLASQVGAGENGGKLLRHEHVVREWIGPIPLLKGKLSTQREIRLNSDWKRDQTVIAGFVQNMATGDILQAVSGRLCTGF